MLTQICLPYEPLSLPITSYYYGFMVLYNVHHRFSFVFMVSRPDSVASLQLCPTDKSMEYRRDFRILHYAGDVT